MQVEQLLQPDLFSRPTAVLSIAIAGSSIGRLRGEFVFRTAPRQSMHTLLADLTSSKASFRVDGGNPETVASQTLAAVASQGLTAATAVKQVQLDYTSLQSCGNACLEESLKVTGNSHSIMLPAAAMLTGYCQRYNTGVMCRRCVLLVAASTSGN